MHSQTSDHMCFLYTQFLPNLLLFWLTVSRNGHIWWNWRNATGCQAWAIQRTCLYFSFWSIMSMYFEQEQSVNKRLRVPWTLFAPPGSYANRLRHVAAVRYAGIGFRRKTRWESICCGVDWCMSFYHRGKSLIHDSCDDQRFERNKTSWLLWAGDDHMKSRSKPQNMCFSDL